MKTKYIKLTIAAFLAISASLAFSSCAGTANRSDNRQDSRGDRQENRDDRQDDRQENRGDRQDDRF
ncbi:MAG: hypothetical protein N2C12_18610 [Planctomycetales bacterium]